LFYIDFYGIKCYHNRDMWMKRGARLFNRLSIRKLLLFVAAVSVASFSYTFTAATPTYAATDVIWNGDALVYNKQQYNKQPDAPAGNSMGLPAGTVIYSYTEDQQVNTSGGTTPPQKTHVIYFDAGTDATKATSAKYVEYNFVPPDKFSNPTNQQTLSISAPSADNNKTTSCAIQGIGWIVCPITNFLASAMDWLFSVLSGFMVVRPVQSDSNNSLFRAWLMMRDFANVAFVIAFMVIIYSQVTSFGISNYGIKKILPRLIVAAVFVNVSYWICAVAIDISNILGYSIQDIFIAMRNNLVGNEGNGWQVSSWSSITGFVLSGGTALTALGIGTYTALAGGVGAIYMLLPILLGVLLSVLVALLVIAARQAIITILVIVSPLAFVAYILPNTEKYFKKWHELGITMLIMFPAFSVVFGGSQLAGVAIIQNATSITMIILGMAVQIAPLAITPLLLRVSGSLLNKVAGIVNNPKKGMVDRTRGWAQKRGEDQKARMLASNPSRRNVMARAAKSIDARNRKREGWRKANEATADANWENTHAAHQIHQATMRASLLKSVGEATAEGQFEAAKHTDAAMQDLDIQARAAKLRVDLSKARVDANWEELRAGNADNSMITPGSLSASALANYVNDRRNLAQELQQESFATRADNRRADAAKAYQLQNYSEELTNNAALRQYAAGIDTGGEAKVEAAAISEITKSNEETVKAGVMLLRDRANKSGLTLKGVSAKIAEDAIKGISTSSAAEIEAAFEAQADDGQIVNLELARMSSSVDQAMLTRVFARNAPTLKAKGGFHLQNMSESQIALKPVTVMNAARAKSFGDTAASNIKDLKYGWVQEVSKNIGDIISSGDPTDLSKTLNNVYQALHNPQIAATIGDRRAELEAIEQALLANGYTPNPNIVI
jgi:hypothetical protein